MLRAQPWVWTLLAVVYLALDQGRQDAGLDPVMLTHLAVRSAVWAVLGGLISTALLPLLAWDVGGAARAVVGPLALVAAAGAWLASFVGIDGLVGLEPGFVALWAFSREQLFAELTDHVLSLLAWSGVAIAILWRVEAEQARASAEAARTAAHRAQLQVVRDRSSPHFLFNALNGAVALVRTDPDLAEHVLLELSELLRASLTLRDAALTDVATDHGIARRYLLLEQIRFEDRLRISEEIDTAAWDCTLPAFTLQALVQNAIKHGSFDPELGITVRVWVDDGLHVVVTNTGCLGEGEAPGRGLDILRAQLRSLPTPGSVRLWERAGVVSCEVVVPQEVP